MPGSDLFSKFSQSINFYTFYCYTSYRLKMFEKCDSQVNRNEWLLLSVFEHDLQQSLSWSLS